ncbi:MAG: bifunctional (p)ppGpp synthetase/guanosine-3',5'-bis(diphosphate) 3'-pyrophosphohydrolase, partial [Treponemataceae bacterium]
TAVLKNTQAVEIMTAPSAHPHVNWLRAVRTAKARGKIRAWLVQNDESLIIDRNIVAKKKEPTILPLPSPQAPLVQNVSGLISSSSVLHVRVEDERNMMIRFANCCRPVTGDAIIGYVSRGRGIIVHRRNCKNALAIPDFEERKIDVEWENTASHLVKRFRVEARRTSDLFSEIEGAVRKHQGHLIQGRLEESEMNRLTGYFTMELEDRDDLKKVLKNLRGIPSVLAIQITS